MIINPVISSKWEYWFPKKFKINYKHYSDSEIKALESLKESDLYIEQDQVTIVYPGSSHDTKLPLILLEGLTKFKRAKIIMMDLSISPREVSNHLHILTGSKGFVVKDNKAKFNWKDKQIEIETHNLDLRYGFPELQEYQIYIERGFQLFRDGIPDFLHRITKNLKENGLLITDYGDGIYEEQKVNPDIKKLGFYKNLKIYKKLTD